MTTALAIHHPKIRKYAQSLTQLERSKHRLWINTRIEALLDPYWQTMPSVAALELIAADWMAALENYDPEEINTACREYLAGRDCRVKPKPGDILKIMRAARAQIIAALPKPVETPFSALDVPADERKAAAARIMGEVFAGKTMGGEA